MLVVFAWLLLRYTIGPILGDLDDPIVIPLVAAALVLDLSAMLGFVLWRRSGAIDGWRSGTNLTLIVACAGSLAGWFALGVAAIRVVEFLYDNQLAPLILFTVAGAFAAAVATSWFWAVEAARRLNGGPTGGYLVCVAVVAAAPYLAESVAHKREVARFERLQLAGNDCQARNSPTIGSKLVQEGCFDLAERTRQTDADALSRAIDIYAWGCMAREPSSCAALAGLYERGEGVRRNLTKAHDLYAEACVLYRHAVSCVNMARMVYEGRGVVERNAAQAVILLDLACRGGEPSVQMKTRTGLPDASCSVGAVTPTATFPT